MAPILQETSRTLFPWADLAGTGDEFPTALGRSTEVWLLYNSDQCLEAGVGFETRDKSRGVESGVERKLCYFKSDLSATGKASDGFEPTQHRLWSARRNSTIL